MMMIMDNNIDEGIVTLMVMTSLSEKKKTTTKKKQHYFDGYNFRGDNSLVNHAGAPHGGSDLKKSTLIRAPRALSCINTCEIQLRVIICRRQNPKLINVRCLNWFYCRRN